MSENLELDQLAAEAAVVDAANVPAAVPEQPEAPKADVAGEVAALLKMVAGMLAPAFPSLATIYTDETCRNLGTAAAPVMEKYGVSVGGLFDRWGAEITLAATALPVALATYQGIKGDMAERKKPADAPTPAEKPEAAPVTRMVINGPGA